jgi:hypothetical protein
VSKVVERSIGKPLLMYLDAHGYSDAQWAFRKKCSSQDLTFYCVSNWILGICSGYKFGVYLSDISGAFDRVFKDFMMCKLCALGVADVFLNFLNAYLEPRVGRVTIENVFSDLIVLADTVFQGTVLGPALWNAFFHDVAPAASCNGGEAVIFADDLSVFKKFLATSDNLVIKADMAITRTEVHKWGTRNRVAFDPLKEHTVIIHPAAGEGDDFKFLGVLFDAKLRMENAVEQILNRIRPKIKALLRTRCFYSVGDMLNQFKTHIWGLIEYQNGAICHACATSLSKLDRIQASFVRDLSLTEEMAFLDFNFAPLCLRRDIGILGFIHKRVIGICHAGIKKLLPFSGIDNRNHSKQLLTQSENIVTRHGLYYQSIYGYVHIYNRLPESLVIIGTVKDFQVALTKMVRRRCTHAWDPFWRRAWSDCPQAHTTLTFLEA